MKKIISTYMLAAVALIFSACSSDLQELAKPASPNVSGEGIPFSATITMGSDSPTRTLLAEGSDGKSITDTWATGDEVALVYKIGTASHVSEAIVTVKDDHSAEITGTIAAGVTDNTPVTIFYPYTAVVQDDPDTYGTLRPNFSGQKGTLEDIATNFDYRQGEGNLMVSDKATLKKTVTMDSQIAIWKLTLKDVANTTTTLAANKFEIMDKDYNKTLISVEPSPTASELYVAVPPASEQFLNFVATKDENKYYYTKSGVTLEKGKYYQSAMTLTDMLNTPLTLEATEASTEITVKNPSNKTIQYKVNNGDLTTISGTTNITLQNAGDIMQFFSVNSALSNVKIIPSKKTYVYGNVMSVIDDGNDGFAKDITIGASYALYGLFYDASNITFHNIKKLELPATTLSSDCYNQMFFYCTGLTFVPENFLPATTLASNCYYQMFAFCSKLKSVPEDLLPATTLKDECYSDMFVNCYELTNAPILPAPTLVNKCYYDMFFNCRNLSSVTCLATDIRATECLKDWLNLAGTAEGITSGTLYVDPSMTNNDYDRWNLNSSGFGTYMKWTISGDVSSSIALSEVTSKHIGWRIGSDGKAYYPVGNLPGTVTAVAMIASVSSTGHGLAIELNNNPPKKEWSAACTYPSTKTAVSGHAWYLPSKEEWETMISASGGYGKFKERYKLAAGYEFKTDTAYWTDEAYDDIEAWGIYALTTQYSFGRYYKSSDQNRALACLSF